MAQSALVEIFANNWQCPCGSKYFFVARTEHDEDFTPIRMRVCRNCGRKKATIEKEIQVSSFFARAHSKTMQYERRKRRRIEVCKRCMKSYQGGTFSEHVLDPDHMATLKHTWDNEQRRRNAERKLRSQRRLRTLRGEALPTGRPRAPKADPVTERRRAQYRVSATKRRST